MGGRCCTLRRGGGGSAPHTPLAQSPEEAQAAPPDAPAEGGRTLQRTVSAATGFREGGRAPTREELVAEGVPPEQVDARLAQQHMDEVIREHFMKVVICLILCVAIILVLMLFGFVYVCIAYFETPDVACDVPLRLWFQVLIFNTVFNCLCNVSSPRTGVSIGQRLFCCYAPPEGLLPAQHPLRVRLYLVLYPLVHMAWCCVGLYWVTISGAAGNHQADESGGPCVVVEPYLYHAIRFYAVVNLIYWACMIVAGFGMIGIFRMLLLRGAFGNLRPAPEGSIERNTKEVPPGDPRLQPSPTCPVCLEPWASDAEKAVVQTKTCGHCFHKECLQQWLGINRTCPLCREDLGVEGVEEQRGGEEQV